MWFEAPVELTVILVVGRLCLSILPPGWPGYHDRREGGATLAASLMLGTLGLELVPWWPVWGVALVVRVALLPGALRPRHEHAAEPAKGPERLLPLVLALATAAVIWVAWTDPGAPRGARLLVAPAQAAGCVWVLQALAARTRRPRWIGAVLAALGALVLVLLANRWPVQVVAPALLAALWIVAGLVLWRRTADRRAGALALLGLLSCLFAAPGGVLG